MAIARAKMVVILTTIMGLEAKIKERSRQPDRSVSWDTVVKTFE